MSPSEDFLSDVLCIGNHVPAHIADEPRSEVNKTDPSNYLLPITLDIMSYDSDADT